MLALLNGRMQGFNSEPLPHLKFVDEFGCRFDAFDELLRGQFVRTWLGALLLDVDVLRCLRLDRVCRLRRNVREKFDWPNANPVAVCQANGRFRSPIHS